MAHLKSLGPGKHAAIAQKLLNEVAAARVRLLDPYKKKMYDRRLREE
jgi:curved DNA-binding protein CbpA